jgi:hypothetical protein
MAAVVRQCRSRSDEVSGFPRRAFQRTPREGASRVPRGTTGSRYLSVALIVLCSLEWSLLNREYEAYLDHGNAKSTFKSN